MSRLYKGLETKLIHAGEPEQPICGAVSLPIFQSSTFEYGGQENYHDIKYIRLNNTPNHVAMHQKLAALENADAAVVTASGMAAISTVFLTLLGAGDHILIQDCLYGGTYDLLTKDLPRLGISFDFIRDDKSDWATKLRSTTRAIYVETISNPLLDVPDLDSVAAFAKEHNIVSIVDNTFASPVNFCPAEHGFDLSIHSCTKYLNGHSDIVGGAIIGKRHLVDSVLHKLNHFGASMDPH
ncbi:MAG: PLP-dependent aspartate aminotransferase family protein, partial [Cyanobacteria bacterium]|nr:PLP-dependent aspartate aminotransferase family protein [Cyanobacteriota bacterium]